MASFFSNLFGAGGLFKRGGSVLGVDIGSSSIKVVQLRREKGQAVLETYGELALGPYGGLSVGQASNLPSEKIAEALKDLFREANVTTKRAALSIPLKSSLLKVIEVPRFDEKQLAQIIPIEARKYIPVPISEVALDWWVIPTHEFSGVEDEAASADLSQGPPKIDVLLVAIHNGTIKKYKDIVTLAELSASIYEVETFSEIRSVLSHDIAPTVIIDIGAGTTKMTIVDYGIVRVSHTINRGAQDVTLALSKALGVSFDEAEHIKRREGIGAKLSGAVGPASVVSAEMSGVLSSIIEFVFYEANRVLIDYQKRSGRLVTKVILTGGGSLLLGLLEVARKTFAAEVTLGDAFSKTEAPVFLREVLRETGPEFTIATGLALRELAEA